MIVGFLMADWRGYLLVDTYAIFGFTSIDTCSCLGLRSFIKTDISEQSKKYTAAMERTGPSSPDPP